jgi:hypothetical protein
MFDRNQKMNAVTNATLSRLAIDEFADGNVLISHPLPAIPAIPGYVEDSQAATVPGGQRHLALWPIQESPHEVFIAVENGQFVAARLRDQSMHMSLRYGILGGMNIDLSEMGALRLEGLAAIEPFKLGIRVTSPRLSGGNPHVAGVSLDIDRSASPVDLDIARAAFKDDAPSASAVDWAQITSLELAFDDLRVGAFSGLRMEAICAMI